MTVSSRRRPSRRRGGRLTSGWRALLFVLPALLLFAAFLVYPMVSTVVMSFFSWNGFVTSSPVFVGASNYVRIFTQDPVFWPAFRNTVIWVVLSLVVPTSLGLVIALGLNRKLFGRNLLRSAFYIPAVLASIAVATMWVWLYNPDSGLVNGVLKAVGLSAAAQDWLGNAHIALYAIFVAFVWQTAGFNMVLYLAGLQGVPEELVEAAKLDGAGPFQVFRAVTWPALRPTTIIVVVLTMISSLKVFDLIVGTTGGGPAQSTQVLALWSYQQSFSNHEFGLGNAIATVLFVVSMILVVPYMIWTFRGDREA
ncbi:sugar ABC transporter permease [Curtobacterium sp. MCBD17_034]|uniref:carbohydrate ABC transporter permease n=1 Tax=unclassified Curtobacterium TaxID=257496 RepID=UPI000DA830FF|nr:MULTISPECIES: sugar ABC transporter permease [unclassified Curtobacterium]PZF56183.1 sugar ABC transporter permease [Curtobacterium sp. MCBD17_034]PZM32952.1 sugar ABC transporter permease [Curtobacterium sp. MCBD17_031]